MGDQRKDLIHDLLLAIDRVDDGLAGVAAHGGLDGCGVGGVDLQRQQRGTLELLGGLLDDLDLVDLGQAHVNVQDVGALFLLADALAHHVVQVAVTQGLLQALLPVGLMRSPMTAILWPSQGRSTTVWALVTDMLACGDAGWACGCR
mgnify:CR=1 FL=1